MIYETSKSQIDDIIALRNELYAASGTYGSRQYESLMRTWNTLLGYTFGHGAITEADYRRCIRTFNRAAARWPELLDAVQEEN